MQMKINPLILVVLMILLGACASNNDKDDTAPPTQDDLATAIAAQSSPTGIATEEGTPTTTPSATLTATATYTQTPIPTETATATVTASPTVSETPSVTPSTTSTLTATAPPTDAASPTVSPTQVVIAAAPTDAPPTETPRFLPSVVPLVKNPSPSPITIGVPTDIPTNMPGIIPTNTPRLSPTPTAIPGDHMWFWRPFERDPSGRVSDAPSRGYSYGSTAGGGLQVHHGIDIENPTGTTVRSIGEGRVFHAGGDLETIFGPRPDFYGNVVVIEHDVLSPDRRPIYSLYGHLSRVTVETGQEVGFGEAIGAVGSEGVAFGPHLHLEIRLGNPFDYGATYHPELWIAPFQNFGVLAGRIVDANGELVPGQRVELIGRGSFIPGWTYESDSVNSDPYYGENFVLGDIRSGQYDLKVGEVRNILYRDVVFIEAGVVNFIEIQLPMTLAEIESQ